MNYPELINENLSKNLFEYDGGDLWIRENVSYWDDQDICWNNHVLEFIEKTGMISEFLWKINYTIPYKDQIKDLENNQNYEIKNNNKFFCEVIKYSKEELNLVDDILLYEPKILVNFINKLKGLKKINVAMNLMFPSDVFMDEDDDWIQTGLNNPDWNTSSFDPSNVDDLKDIKYIKDNIEPNITFDFSMDEKDMKILKDNKILLV
tara:strand:+ start:5374 stop:5991 length:618 start_codon:yes stop_codon:yes gene_type:complete